MAAANTAQFIAYVADANDATCKDMSIYLENSGYTPAFVNKQDARKMSRVSGKPYVYTLVDGIECGTTATNDLEGTFIVVCTTAATQYVFSFDKVDGRQLYLKDYVTNTLTPITATDTYTFTASANSTLADRFQIVKPEEFKICYENDYLVISNNPYTTNTIVKDAEGNVVVNEAPGVEKISLESLPAGHYTVELNGGEKKYIIAVKPTLETPAP